MLIKVGFFTFSKLILIHLCHSSQHKHPCPQPCSSSSCCPGKSWWPLQCWTCWTGSSQSGKLGRWSRQSSCLLDWLCQGLPHRRRPFSESLECLSYWGTEGSFPAGEWVSKVGSKVDAATQVDIPSHSQLPIWAEPEGQGSFVHHQVGRLHKLKYDLFY